MEFSVRPIKESFAHEVVGLRLWEPVASATAEALRTLLSEHGVLIFRRQALSEDEFANFSALFGKLELTVRTDWASKVRPEVGILSNLRDGTGAPIGGLSDGELNWHSDQSYILEPATGAGLYAVELTNRGGATRWAHLGRAYEALPPGLLQAVEGKQGIFSYSKRLAGYSSEDQRVPEESKRRIPDVVHPLVMTHPTIGKRSLYLDPTTMIGVVGMTRAAADDLLGELIAFSTQPRFVYEHAWQVGDVVYWDNGFLLHQRDGFPATERRLMKRATIFLSKTRHMVPEGELAEPVVDSTQH